MYSCDDWQHYYKIIFINTFERQILQISLRLLIQATVHNADARAARRRRTVHRTPKRSASNYRSIFFK
jgi:hypothetical protein